MTGRRVQERFLPHPLDRPVLTVAEAGRLLGRGRSAAYSDAQRWLATDGREGLPVLRLGRQLVVPTAALWRMLGLSPDAHAPDADAERPPAPAGGRTISDDHQAGRAVRGHHHGRA